MITIRLRGLHHVYGHTHRFLFNKIEDYYHYYRHRLFTST